MSKILNDAYYTPKELAYRLCKKTIDVIGKVNISDVIEPSAGMGAFSDFFGQCESYDIDPKRDYIKKADFLTVELAYLKGRLFIGNPPFGNNNWQVLRFYNKCCACGDYIAFILPISQLNNPISFYKFDLIYSEDLGVVKYSDIPLHCCFNIYQRPKSGGLNSKPNFTLKDITIVEYRRVKGTYSTGHNKCIKEGFDYAMCNWGSSSLGKVPHYVGEYAQEVYFYCHNKQYLYKMLELLSFERIRAFSKSISAKKISVMRLYKYLKDNIPGIQ